jgi:hypothetical protein
MVGVGEQRADLASIGRHITPMIPRHIPAKVTNATHPSPQVKVVADAPLTTPLSSCALAGRSQLQADGHLTGQ